MGLEPHRKLLIQNIIYGNINWVSSSSTGNDFITKADKLISQKKSVINIYYHDEEALVRMQNIIDSIIGEEEVMSKVRFIRQDDTKNGILVPQKESALVKS
ncbi:MAG: hypothetical protein ACI37T_06560 [Candidatus Gastranaerophilaceae bacterium]